MKKFDLVGVDGNAFSIMAYTKKAMKTAGFDDDIPAMIQKATSGDYNNLIRVCSEYIDAVNMKLSILGF